MKKQLILVSIILFPFFANYSQTLKTMTSDYDDGKMTYQYYEDSKTSEFIKQGMFRFQKSLKDENGGGTYKKTITGTFKNGFKDGVWIFSLIKIDFPNDDGSYTTGTTYLTQTFKEGVANGLWKLNSSFKMRSKIYVAGRLSWGVFGKTYTEFASTNFVNSYATGITTYKYYNSSSSKTVSFNKNGFLIGNYIFPSGIANIEVTFNNYGVVTKNVVRDSSGNVTYKTDFDNELIMTTGKYLKGELTNEQFKQSQIKMDTIKATNFIDFGNLFEHDYYFLPYLKGDKTVNTYGRYIYAEKIKLTE